MHGDGGEACRKHMYALPLQGQRDFPGALFLAQGEGDDMQQEIPMRIRAQELRKKAWLAKDQRVVAQLIEALKD